MTRGDKESVPPVNMQDVWDEISPKDMNMLDLEDQLINYYKIGT